MSATVSAQVSDELRMNLIFALEHPLEADGGGWQCDGERSTSVTATGS